MNLSLKAVFLDAGSLGENFSFNQLTDSLPNLTIHGHTENQDILRNINDCQIVITNKVKLSKAHFLKANKLKLVIITATGSDNIDINAAAEAGITVCNVKQYSVNSVSQHALTLMLMLATQAHRYNQDVREGRWSNAKHFSLLNRPILELHGKTLGIVGFGDLGKQLARLVQPFQMQVLLCNIPGRKKQQDRLSLSKMLQRVDFLSLHCPLTSNTKNMIAETELNLMKSSAFIINTARGQLIDSIALAKALKSGSIGGAGIDVLDNEPPSIDHGLLDLTIPNLIITPHNAWGSYESRRNLIDGVIKNIKAFIEDSPINVLKPS